MCECLVSAYRRHRLRLQRGLLVMLLSVTCLHIEAGELRFQWMEADRAVPYAREILREHHLEQRLHKFVQRNLNLKADIEVLVLEADESFFDAHQNKIFLPYRFLQGLNERLVRRYPQQVMVREQVFTNTVEQLLWFHLARALVSQFSLGLEGVEAYALDSFVALMLLNLSEAAYFLDAAEEFLIIDHTQSLLQSERFESELEFDQARYHMMVCIAVGHDYQPSAQVLKSLAWEAGREQQCREIYRHQLATWIEALEPHLKPDNQLQLWLTNAKAKAIDKTVR